MKIYIDMAKLPASLQTEVLTRRANKSHCWDVHYEEIFVRFSIEDDGRLSLYWNCPILSKVNLPEVIQSWAASYCYSDQFYSPQFRPQGIHTYASALAELLSSEEGQYSLVIEAEHFVDLLSIYRKIRVGESWPQEAYDYSRIQVARPKDLLPDVM